MDLNLPPNTRALHVAAADLNGLARGKRYPAYSLEKAASGGVRFPLSVLNLDIWGDDIENSPLVMASGDRDGVLKPTGRGPVLLPWLDTPTALLPVWMFREDGAPFEGDPRHALDRVVKRYHAKNWRPVVAFEMEFTLTDLSSGQPQPPGAKSYGGEILSMRALERFDGLLSEIYDGCAALDIPADSVFSEGGLGQFEMNMIHSDDPLKAADDAWLFKMLVKGIARKHGLVASFTAKPYPDWAGNGMHMHLSVKSEDGRNLFDSSGPAGSPYLRQAIAGCLRALPGSLAIFAPHTASYDRLEPGLHAPTSLCWAYENRTAMLRVPSGAAQARRFEQRLPGGDVNPYLSMAAILGAAMNGIEDRAEPGAPITGNAYEQSLPQVARSLQDALRDFSTSADIKRIFDPLLIDNYARTKRQEIRVSAAMDPEDLRMFSIDTL